MFLIMFGRGKFFIELSLKVQIAFARMFDGDKKHTVQ